MNAYTRMSICLVVYPRLFGAALPVYTVQAAPAGSCLRDGEWQPQES